MAGIQIDSSSLTLYIIRGVPGSGKSTYAKNLIAQNSSLKHYEADMAFYNKEGTYVFDPKLLKFAHNWCFNQVKEELLKGNSVIVSNTFTQKWEIERYIKLGKECSANIIIKKAVGNFNNIHGVPLDKVDSMKARWEDVEGEENI